MFKTELMSDQKKSLPMYIYGAKIKYQTESFNFKKNNNRFKILSKIK